MSVNVKDALIRALLVEFGQDQFLHPEHHAVLAADPDGCAADKAFKANGVVLDTSSKPGRLEEKIHSLTSDKQMETHLLFSTAFMAYST